MQRRLSFLSLLVVCGACKSAAEEVTIYFPSQDSLDATAQVAVTIFEPFLSRPDTEAPEFVPCDRVGVFPPPRLIDLDLISNFPNLGRVLKERETQTFPFDSSWHVEVPEVGGDEKTNPWGAVMVLVEARGQVRSPDELITNDITATLLQGCYCVRTEDGTHSDRQLDAEVKTACPMLGGIDGTERERAIDLKPVAPPEFELGPCSVQNLTSPRNQEVSPGPAVCVRAIRCDDAPMSGGCFECPQPCDELNDLRNVPVVFTIDQPGGASEPKAQVVLTSDKGLARGKITVDGCDTAVGVEARVVGRSGPAVRFEVQCVEPLTKFNCGSDKQLLTTAEPQKMTRLPGNSGPDFVAILYGDGQNASLSLVNPFVAGSETNIVKAYPGETPRAVHGFFYDFQDRQRPSLAVATSVADRLKLYLYEWNGTELVAHDGLEGVIAEDCDTWFCGSLDACDPEVCGVGEICGSEFGRCMEDKGPCKLKIEFQTEVSMASKDVDGDGRSDLAIATNGDVPVTTYFSSRAGANRLYAPQGCSCSQFAQAPATFELITFGGSPNDSVDLIVGAAGGAFVKYAQDLSDGSSALSCGQPCRFGDLVPVRDVTRGHFQCNPSLNLCPYDDIVVVEAKSLGGGSFDDPGTIRVVFGDPSDQCLVEDLFSVPGTNVELPPLTLGAQPTDPRTAEVGDFNDDGHDDLAVLFASSEEVHVWLGASNKGLGEVERGIVLADCELAETPQCGPMFDFALPDFDDDGRSDVAVVCKQNGDNRLRWYTPGLE